MRLVAIIPPCRYHATSQVVTAKPPFSRGKIEDSQEALQKALQIDPAALLAAIANLTAEQRAEILKALGVQ